jgi:hypothetical protein
MQGLASSINSDRTIPGKLMKNKIIIPFLFTALFAFQGYAQVSIKDSSIFTSMFYAGYSVQFPGGDLAKIFGVNSSIGGGMMFKTKSNWIFGAEANFLFGGSVKNTDSLLKNISTPDGFIIDANGYYADIIFYERGYSIYGKFGKLIPVLAPNPNSGLTILAGAGYIQDKIRIHNPGNTAPQVFGDYKKGYDHLNSGIAVNGSIGYTYMSNSRLLNFYLGFEFIQSWTKSRRDYDFELGAKEATSYSSQFYGIKLVWMIPLYKRTPKSYYLY